MKSVQTFDIRGMHCASCAQKIEQALESLPGVESCAVNLATRKAVVTGSVGQEKIFQTVLGLGYEAVVGTLLQETASEVRSRLIIAGLFTVTVVGLSMLMVSSAWSGWVQLALSIPVFWAGRDFFFSAWRLARRYSANMD